MDDIKAYIKELGLKARVAARVLAAAETAAKDAALHAMADDLDNSRDALMAENRKDLEAGKAKGLDAEKDSKDILEILADSLEL